MSKIKIQEVSSVGCSSCVAAKKILDEDIKSQFPHVEIEYIDMLSDEGQKMVRDHGIMASPGIIVNGELFSSGALDKKRLVKKIQSLT